MKPLIRNLVTAAAMIAAIGLCAPPAHEQEKETVRAGYLTCHVAVSRQRQAAAMSKTIPDSYAHPGHH